MSCLAKLIACESVPEFCSLLYLFWKSARTSLEYEADQEVIGTAEKNTSLQFDNVNLRFDMRGYASSHL